ncbi:LPS export ABC transporter periplasmic protein LptC [PVC group bacterium (ex Bugula neritina AB1)]|nr:LPS export ABC transporter periplasmic protein LptC [PVC group bacterium (ex Bugula neritina AB1)]
MRKFLIYIFIFHFFPLFLIAQEGNQAEQLSLAGYTPDGHKKWDLLADVAQIFPGKKDITLKKPKGTLYEKGEPNLHLKATSGTYAPDTGHVFLQEDVHLKTNEGSDLQTSDLFWDSKKSLLKMKNDIQIVKENNMISGKNMTIHKNKNRATIEKNVTLKNFNKHANEHPSVITCSGKMEFNYDEDFVELFDNVSIVDPRLNLRADYMKIFFDRITQKLDRVLCQGNVMINQDLKKAMGEMAEYDVSDGAVYLTGNPKVLKNNHILTAENITFFLNKEEVLCEPSAQLVLFFSEEDRDFFNI